MTADSTRPNGRACPQCGLLFLVWPPEGCPQCGEPEVGTAARPTEWVRLHSCPDEWTALRIQAELAGQGIDCWLRWMGVPGYPGLIGINSVHWGWVLVDREDEDAAREVLQAILLVAEPDPVGKDEST